MRIALSFTLVLLCGIFHVACVASAQETPDPFEDPKESDRFLQLKNVFDLEYATDPQISPDGEMIAFVRNSFDIMKDRRVSQIWTIRNGKIRPLISGTDSSNSPRWSPTGNRLAYSSTNTGSNQLHIHWIDDNRSTAITRLPQPPSGISWSPDGQWLAFSMRVPAKKKPFATLPAKPDGAQWADAPEMITRFKYRADGAGYLPEGFRQLFVVSSNGGTPRQLTFENYNHGGRLAWSSDSTRIYFSGNLRKDAEFQPANSEIYQLEMANRKITQMTNRNGPDASPAVSPNGEWIAYVGNDDKLLGHHSNALYVMGTDGKSKPMVLLQKLDRVIQAPTWNHDSSAIYFQYDDSGETRIAMVKLDGRMGNLVSNVGGTSLGRPYASGSFSVSKNGKIAYTACSTQHPSDVGLLNGSDTTRLTALNDDLFAFKQLGQVEELKFQSSHDGVELEGWVVKPPNFDADKKYPLILEIHGGPFANYGPRFAAELQLYAAAGYVVLYMNPRGSTSYGAKFANYIHHNYPGNDYDDLMTGVDEVIKRGYVDPERLYVTGGSGGGVLTSWIVGKTNRFKAAVVAKPVINWYSFALTADSYNYFYKYWFSGFPWDQPEEYLRRSPISLVGNVTTPTMLLTGTEDYRTPMSETEQYYQALKLRKVDTALVRIPGASHSIAARPSQLAAKVAYILKWFETHP